MTEPNTAPPARTVVVTGGARGIGLACARAFAGAGDRVAVLSRTSTVDDLLCLPCDVADAAAVDDAFAKVEAELGRVQVVVSNAGITRDGLLARMKDDEWGDVLDANLTGAFHVARRSIQSMMRGKWGRLVFVSSVGAYVGSPGQANYAASKAGVIGLARSIAREYGSRNITANVVAPGPIDTEMIADLGDDWRAQVTGQSALGRIGTAAEVAAAVRFLASDEASYVTGVVLPVDGGLGMGF